jgi:hypothetical protein
VCTDDNHHVSRQSSSVSILCKRWQLNAKEQCPSCEKLVNCVLNFFPTHQNRSRIQQIYLPNWCSLDSQFCPFWASKFSALSAVFWLQTARISAAVAAVAASLHHHCCLGLCRDHHTLGPNELDKNNNYQKKGIGRLKGFLPMSTEDGHWCHNCDDDSGLFLCTSGF